MGHKEWINKQILYGDIKYLYQKHASVFKKDAWQREDFLRVIQYEKKTNYPFNYTYHVINVFIDYQKVN